MSTLTKKQKETMEYVLRNLQRSKAYLTDPRIAIARKCDFASTTLHYSRADGKSLYEVEKTYGSDLTGLFSAIDTLENFLNPKEI
jgi:hypothetical protein